jgi:hypothetical protein
MQQIKVMLAPNELSADEGRRFELYDQKGCTGYSLI